MYCSSPWRYSPGNWLHGQPEAGPSGTGKTTLISLAAGLIHPTEGRVLVGEVDLAEKTEAERRHLRLTRLGLVFQEPQLIPYLTLRQNLLLMADLLGRVGEAAQSRADPLLDRVGLTHRGGALPAQVSGGERQRASLARALMNNPDVLLCDEPTASLDADRAFTMMEMLAELVRREGKSALVVTHDSQLFPYADQVLYLSGGRLTQGESQGQSRIGAG